MPNPKAAGEDPDAPRCLSQGIMYSLRVVLGKSHAYNLYGNVYPAKPYSMNIQELYCWVVVVFARNANEDDFLAATDQFGEAVRRLRPPALAVMPPAEPPGVHKLKPDDWARLQRTRKAMKRRSQQHRAARPG